MKVASFFAGIGGFDLGFEQVGMEVVFQCEISRFNQKVLQQRWSDTPRHDDIRTLDINQIPESDIWCGGFPCQDVSLANNGKREGLNGQRSGLFYTFKDLVCLRKPRWIVLENVPGLLSSQNGEDFRTITRSLDELGYGVAWRVLDAKFFGTPQRRRRVFIVASYGSLRAAQVLFDDERIAVTLTESKRQAEGITCKNEKGNSRSIVYAIQNAAIGRVHTSGPQGPGYRSDGESWTFDSRGTADAICAPTNAFRIRDATNIPLGLDSNRYRSLGNAVNVAVAQWIGTGILAAECAESECIRK